MIIYKKDDKSMEIPCGLGPNVCAEQGYELQMKHVDSSTELQHVEPDSSYYGLYRVIVDPYELDAKTVDPSTVSQTVTSDKDGLSSVTVNAVTAEIDPDLLAENIKKNVEILGVTGTFEGGSLGSKTVNSSTVSQTVTPDSSDYGLSSVTVNPYTLESKSQVITNNGDYTITADNSDALSQVTLNVSVEGHAPVLQAKEVDSSTSSQSVTPDQGYDGLSSVTVSPYTLDTKTVDPSINAVTVTSDADGLSSVTVNAITAAIDPDLVAGNIKKDVEILGVTGSFEGGTLQSKTVNSSTVSQTVNPDGANYGLSSVTVNPYSVEAKSDTITVNGQYSYSPSNSDALSGVTIDVQVADIPAVVQTKSVVYNVNGEYTVTKDAGYDGMSSVDISVNVPHSVNLEGAKTVNSSTVSQTVTYDSTQYDGLSSVTVNPYTLENKTVNSSTVQQTVSASTADGLAQVTIEPYTLDSKTVDASTVSQTVTSSNDGLSSVTVNAVDSNIDPNILSNNIKNGVTILGITGSYVGQTINNQNKTIDSSTTSQSITADNGYTGLGTVTVNPYTLDTKTVDPSTSSQTVNSSTDGMSAVTVNAVTASIDSNIKAGNIKDGVTILGVTGSYSGQTINNQNKTVDSSTTSQSVTADAGYTGLGTVTVNPYTLDNKTVDPSTSSQTVNSSADGLSSVTVNAVTSSIDNNITASNIKSGVTILGVQGTYTGQTINNQNKTINPSINSQSVTADAGYTGLGTVTFNGVTSSIDSNITAGNIKDGVTILGVQGTYTGSGSGGNEYTYIHLDNSVEPSLAGSGTGMQISGVNPWLIVMCGGSPDPSTGYSYTLLNKFCTIVNNRPSDVSVTNTVRKITYICKEIRMASPSGGNAICSSTVTPDVTEIEFPDLHSVPYSIANWITPWRDVKLTVHWKALTESVQNRNVTSNLGSYLKELVIEPWDGLIGEQYINEDIHLDWSPSLNYASVLGVFSRLSSTDPHTVTFYTGGLTVQDDAQGTLQTAYSAATTVGWTINNLTIQPPQVIIEVGDPSTSITQDNEYRQAFMNEVADKIIVHGPDITNSSGQVFYQAFKDCSVGEVVFPELTSINASTNTIFYDAFNGATIDTLSFPVLTSYGDVNAQYGVFRNCMYNNNANVRKIKGQPWLFRPYNGEVSLLYGATSVTEIELLSRANNSMFFRWQPLTRDTVIHILSMLDTPVTSELFFREGGLTVQDDAQGTIQTLYNNALGLGWTIRNLTITPYSS